MKSLKILSELIEIRSDNKEGEAIIFGVGYLSLAHKPNEYMEIDRYLKYNDYLLNILDIIGENLY